MICGVSFLGLEIPVWHVSYVFMLLQPHINKSWLECKAAGEKQGVGTSTLVGVHPEANKVFQMG